VVIKTDEKKVLRRTLMKNKDLASEKILLTISPVKSRALPFMEGAGFFMLARHGGFLLGG